MSITPWRSHPCFSLIILYKRGITALVIPVSTGMLPENSRKPLKFQTFSELVSIHGYQNATSGTFQDEKCRFFASFLYFQNKTFHVRSVTLSSGAKNLPKTPQYGRKSQDWHLKSCFWVAKIR